jgi:hypothetical protein
MKKYYNILLFFGILISIIFLYTNPHPNIGSSYIFYIMIEILVTLGLAYLMKLFIVSDLKKQKLILLLTTSLFNVVLVWGIIFVRDPVVYFSGDTPRIFGNAFVLLGIWNIFYGIIFIWDCLKNKTTSPSFYWIVLYWLLPSALIIYSAVSLLFKSGI